MMSLFNNYLEGKKGRKGKSEGEEGRGRGRGRERGERGVARFASELVRLFKA